LKRIKIFLKSLFRAIGLEIRLTHTDHKENLSVAKKINQENKWLFDYGIKSIVDIGANEGQFALKMREIFPEASIFSFEPITEVCDKLINNFRNDKNFKAFNFGLGNKEEKIKFWLNEYSPSSSILEMTNHLDHFDFAKKSKEIEIEIRLLDTFKDKINLVSPYLIKIDVQGYEDKVIKGGLEILKKAHIIITEVSFVQLYSDQVLFDEIYSQLTQLGFSYAGNFEQLYSPLNNQILQADAIFIKNKI
jgi:FkbM family methyltransferase